MKEIINLVKSTIRKSYGYAIALAFGMLGTVIMFLIFDDLRPLTMPVSLVFITFLGIRSFQQFQRNRKYNNDIDYLVDMLEHNSKGAMDALNTILASEKGRLKNIESDKVDAEVRQGLFSNKEKEITNLKLNISTLQKVKRMLKKEKSAV